MSLITHKSYYSGDNAEMIDTAYVMRTLAGDDTEGALFGVWVTLTLLADNDFHTSEQFCDMVCCCLKEPEVMNAHLDRMSPFVNTKATTQEKGKKND